MQKLVRQAEQAVVNSESPPRDSLNERRSLDWRIVGVAFLIGAAVVLLHRPWRQIETGDEAIWDYVSQGILRGQMPYRDIVEIKTPLSAYLSAAAMGAGRIVGVSDPLAARLLNLLMVGLLSAVTFAVAHEYLRNASAAVLAFLIPLAPSHFAEWMTGGTQPKLPMLLFGLLSLWLVARDRPFWAGFCSTLAFLCWQPGLMFAGAALLIFSRYLTSWRDRRALQVILGATLPLAAMLLYFAAHGTLADLWKWTITYNVRFYAPESARGLGPALGLLWRVTNRVFRYDVIFVALAVAGLCWYAVEQARERADKRGGRESGGLFRDALLIPPLVYLGFCLVNFQSGPDLIPFFPFIGIFGAWFIAETLRAVASRVPSLSMRTASAVTAAAIILVLGLIAYRGVAAKYEYDLTLRDQYRETEKLHALLGPGDKIYVHGMAEILVLLDRPNLNPYIFFDRGKDNAVCASLPGGFRQILDGMEAEAPRLVAVARLGKVAHRAELEDWLHRHYDPLRDTTLDDVYLRKPGP